MTRPAAVGQPRRRVEDRALLTGAAQFTGDVAARSARSASGALTLAFVRSTVAHARVVTIETAAARAAPGVAGVYTAADLGDVHGLSAVPVPEELIRPLLARDVVRFVGEIVAVIAATDEGAAVDAAELVEVDYEPLPIVADLDAALADGAPRLHDGFDSNTVIRAGGPIPAGFADGAAIVVEVDMTNQRVGVVPLETNAVLAEPDGDGLRVHVSTQAPHLVRDGIAALCGLDPAAVHVIAPAVGGGFGAKSTPDPEYVLACRIALDLGRAVAWRQTRTENLLTMHGRAQRQQVTVAAAADGTLLRLHADLIADGGGYPGMNHFLATLTALMVAGTYRFESATTSITSVATNTAPPVGYRGAGRPEAACLVERTVDVVAAELGIDPAELRRRNLIPATAFPSTSPTGAVYDSGDYRAALDRALALARYDDRRRDQAVRRATADPQLLGIGVSAYVEVTAGAGPTEFADVEVHADATVTVRVGTFGHGQGHRTTFAQIAADALLVEADAVTVIDGDTALVARGFGTYGSRSTQVGGSAVAAACVEVAQRARELSADALEAAVDDVVHDDSGFTIAGVPARRLSWADVARAATTAGAGDGGARPGLFATVDWARPAPTFPFGAHVAVVEVDSETGMARLVEHVAVDDCGTVVNPLLAEGQVHGGIAQGAAQALLEAIVYDAAGNDLTSNLADYAAISAAELPSFTLDRTVTPSPVNPLGVKGIGESGTIGALPAVHNAVIDALAHLGVRHLDMPCTPERVWRAIHERRRGPVRVHR